MNSKAIAAGTIVIPTTIGSSYWISQSKSSNNTEQIETARKDEKPKPKSDPLKETHKNLWGWEDRKNKENDQKFFNL
ncbi:hypothetical protein [Candidatus Mycoplasma haematohominis]|uniref:hypothetical protein n=1 Tax=Candidatus Mycoplasma haematohominis TaxID=1494318 RepID=UPI001C0A70B0|nr:hypothetical protein [Candidatus Mycoplasma haemohominis]